LSERCEAEHEKKKTLEEEVGVAPDRTLGGSSADVKGEGVDLFKNIREGPQEMLGGKETQWGGGKLRRGPPMAGARKLWGCEEPGQGGEKSESYWKQLKQGGEYKIDQRIVREGSSGNSQPVCGYVWLPKTGEKTEGEEKDTRGGEGRGKGNSFGGGGGGGS